MSSTTTTTITTSADRDMPTADEVAIARKVANYYLRGYNFGGDVNDACNAVNRAGRLLAPAVYESALDSGCTDVRPADGERRMTAWDMCAVAHMFNAIVP